MCGIIYLHIVWYKPKVLNSVILLTFTASLSSIVIIDFHCLPLIYCQLICTIYIHWKDKLDLEKEEDTSPVNWFLIFAQDMGVIQKSKTFVNLPILYRCYLKVFIGFIYYLHIVWYYIKPEYLTDFLYLPMIWVLLKNLDFCKFAY